MNKYDKEIIEAQLRSERTVLTELRQMYDQALKDIDDKIAQLMGRTDTENLQSIIYQVDYQKALRSQISAILDNLSTTQFDSISQYLTTSYEDGFIGTMYALQKQGIPLILPIDQRQVVQAITKDTQLSQTLYTKLKKDTDELKKRIQSEISRGISQGYSYEKIAKNLANQTGIGYNKAVRIAKTESHRIRGAASLDAAKKAKEKGADVVKQWDATLDRKVRPEHRMLDGQIRDLDEPFDVNGHKAMQPGGFGKASLDINCRCALLQRAKWAVEDKDDSFTKWDAINEELLTIKSKNYETFKNSYQKMVDDNITINDVTNRLLEKAKAAEPGITRDLQEIIGATNGTISYDVGNGKTALDFRLKGAGSLKRKITTDFVEGTSLDYIEDHIYDNVRYTDLVDGDLLVGDYVDVQRQLEKKGYKIVRVKNTLGDSTKAYRGLSTVVESPDGYRFELQFHTPESIDIKERVHKLYELSRLDTTSLEERIRLNEEMIKISSTLPDIKDIGAIKSYDMFKGESRIEVIIDTQKKITVSTSSFPKAFTASRKLEKNTQLLAEYINAQTNADPRVVELYSKLAELENLEGMDIPFKIAHSADKNALVTKYLYSGELTDVKLTLVDLSKDNSLSAYGTNLHELGHLIDLYGRPDFSKTGALTKIDMDRIKEVLKKSADGMSDEISDLFKRTFEQYEEISKEYRAVYDELEKKLKMEVEQGNISWMSYRYRVDKAFNEMISAIDTAKRNLGVNGLEDIYDALSGGLYRDTGKVKYGHSSKYYRDYSNRISEIFANYLSLGVVRPDLVGLLRKDKPELTQLLDGMIDDLLRGIK